MSSEYKRDIYEAISLLNEAKNHLRKAYTYLDRASTTSILDIVFSGFLSLIMDIREYRMLSKAGKEIKKAESIIKKARSKLENQNLDFSMEEDWELWTFFDIAFDSILVDLLKHKKIEDVKEEIDLWIRDLDKMIRKLEEIYTS